MILLLFDPTGIGKCSSFKIIFQGSFTIFEDFLLIYTLANNKGMISTDFYYVTDREGLDKNMNVFI